MFKEINLWYIYNTTSFSD